MPHVCRTCLCGITDKSFVSIEGESPVKSELIYCIPEMVTDLVTNPVMCTSCATVLHSMYQFKQQCLQSDKRIYQTLQDGVVEPNSVSLFETFYLGSKCGNIQSYLRKISRTPQTSVTDCDIKVDGIEIEDHILDLESNHPETSTLMLDENSVDVEQRFTETELTRRDSERKTELMPKTNAQSKVSAENELKRNSCDYTTQLQSNIKRLEDGHDHVRLFQCELCDFNCTCYDNLIIHIAQHNNVKRFACNSCKYRTALKNNLERHIVLMHIQKKKFKSAQAQLLKHKYNITDKSSMEMFIVKHNDENKFQCAHCSFVSSWKRSLRRHLLVHSGQKPFECHKCDYKTYQNFYLHQHLKTHVECRVCNYSTTKSKLHAHMKMHSENNGS